LEKHNQEKKCINLLNNPETNRTVSNHKDILKEIEIFYSELYKENSKEAIDCTSFTTQENVPKLSDIDRNMLDGQLTEEECYEAINDLPNGKSPGTDGIPVEFYKCFWTEIKNYLMDSLEYSYLHGELSIEQKRGLITLIPKGDKDSTHLGNWRPITLLNCDYKILTKTLANRLHLVLDDLISTDQAAYIKNRYIGDNIRVVDDLIYLSNRIDLNGIILLLDFQKAFDTLRWDFIYEMLSSFGVGEGFERWVKILYCNTSSSVLNNGHGTKFFGLSRGIRQGCPISALLFIMSVELLATKIRNCKNISGITIDGKIIKINQFADDTAIFLQSEKDLETLLIILRDFENISGLKLNKSKSEAIRLGVNSNINIGKHGFKWNDEEFRYLGIWFHKDPIVKEYLNFRHRLEKMKNLLRIWLARDLSLKGKITVLKSLIVSMLLFPMTNITTPEWVIKECNFLFFKFLWNGKPDKIKRDVIIQDIEHGGMKMVNIESMLMAIKANWIRKLVDETDEKWKIIPNYFFKGIELEYFLNCRFLETDIPVGVPPFYIQILLSYKYIFKKEPTSAMEVMQESLWCNSKIQVDSKTVFYNDWYIVGIRYIGDIVNVRGELLSLNEINRKFNINITNFLMYLSICKAIPNNWKKLLSEEPEDNLFIMEEVKPSVHMEEELNVDITYLTSKQLYWIFIRLRQPTLMSNEAYWNTKFDLTPDMWYNIYYLPYTATRETKLQTFQYKILHLIFACGLKLKHWRIQETPNCPTCLVTDDIEHYFVTCKNVDVFWSSLRKWWYKLCKNCVRFNSKEIILGSLDSSCHRIQINYIILKGKWFIHKRKLTNQVCDFLSFLSELKGELNMERQIYFRNKKGKMFEKLWNFVYDEL